MHNPCSRKYLILFFTVSLLFVSVILACNHRRSAPTVPVSTDAPKAFVAVAKDSASPRESSLADRGDYDNSEPSFGEVMEQYAKDCRDTVRIDTLLVMLGKKLHVEFRHFSTGDSLIHLDKPFLDGVWRDTSLKEFTTSNFESVLKVSDGAYVLLDTVIRSAIFHRYVQDNPWVKVNGVLFYGGMKCFSDTLRISYSYSVPLTDLGIGVAVIYPAGEKLYTQGD